MRYVPVGGEEEATLAPEGASPRAVLVETDDAAHPGDVERFRRMRRSLAHFTEAWEGASFSPMGSLVLAAAAPISLVRLALLGYAPLAKQLLRDNFRARVVPLPHTDFAPPFAPAEAAALLARTLKSIGASRRFAPLVFVLGHGAATVNNPFAAAYNCGACGGRDGGPNARLFARIANDAAVRAALARDHGITIPSDTVFVGGKHNTTADEIEFVDEERIPETVSHGGWQQLARTVPGATTSSLDCATRSIARALRDRQRRWSLRAGAMHSSDVIAFFLRLT